MENSTLVALSGQIALRRKLDVIANNVANINTDGFKKVSVDFEETTMPKASGTMFPANYRANSYVRELGTVNDFSAGNIEMTGRELDVALNDDQAFFTVQTPNGERYTRAGNFQLDVNGRLITPDGNPVLGQGGEIIFAGSETNITISADGAVSSSAGSKGKLKLAEFNDPSVLSKVGINLYDSSLPPTVPTFPGIAQGAIERSNVSGVREMTNMIEVQRAYEQIASLMKQQNELKSKAVDRLGTVTA
ncbi:flagellar basal-body rod protein FlgF [Oryzibacter oryziterrae]|uniref:flagellar basal-body rod protein FlgF n=1 Tax=Oryzibacter oryziterrae TaxID=2766474 RepID=UPI001F02ED77|nr:flagellar basal-body rod protein FlgF [Oryzibacter oryziterrae]